MRTHTYEIKVNSAGYYRIIRVEEDEGQTCPVTDTGQVFSFRKQAEKWIKLRGK